MLYSRLTQLGHLSIEEFLSEYWQKKPVFLPNALPDLPQIDANELAGFALESEIESRLIIEKPKAKQSDWQVQHGPLDENIFSTLPESHWTLLVQAVDQLLPECHALLNRFRFLPNWRLDDIMASYAVDQGSVGPHFDYYDVFLLQATGQRQWHIGQGCDHNSALQPNVALKLLEHFDMQESYTVQPGDVLYIPPNIAHWGVAQGESITYSVGFRAPSHSEVITEFADFLAPQINEDQRYSDADFDIRANPGEVTQQDIKRVQNILTQAIANPETIGQWLAQSMTEAKRASVSFSPEQDEGYRLMPNVRSAFVRQAHDAAQLYVNGESFLTSLLLAQSLCDYSEIQLEAFTKADQKIIIELQGKGYIA